MGKQELSLLFGEKKKVGGGRVGDNKESETEEGKDGRMSSSDEDCVVRNEPAGDFNHLWRKLICTYCRHIHDVIQDGENMIFTLNA